MTKVLKTKWYLTERDGNTHRVLLAWGGFATKAEAEILRGKLNEVRPDPLFHCWSVRGDKILANPGTFKLVLPKRRGQL